MQRQRRGILSESAELAAKANITSAAQATGRRASSRTTQRQRNRRRSTEFIVTVQKLDTATDPQSVHELMEFLDSLYQVEDLPDRPFALFGQCYLGHPYLDHVMTLEGGILEHFTNTEQIDPEYRAARGLARSGAYAYIELYRDGSVVPIRETGDPVA
ncbi:MAG: hypothetical protein ACK5LN_13560 [Propioniciclava sp.]